MQNICLNYLGGDKLIKASKLIDWCKQKVGNGYVYASFGQLCNFILLKQLQVQWGAIMGEGYYQLKKDYTKGRCAKWLGKYVFDCSGLIKAGRKELSGVWEDVSAQGTYDQCKKRGPIKDMPMIPGCTVYMYSEPKKRMAHVGIYIGDGIVIEARGVDYGVVQTKLSNRAWQHWGLLDWVTYDKSDEKWKPVLGTESDAGDATNSKPDDKVNFESALLFLDGKIDIDVEYWKRRDKMDPYFDDLIIKIATEWQNKQKG
jgi:cell wall-associated NlpC family hydrolase